MPPFSMIGLSAIQKFTCVRLGQGAMLPPGIDHSRRRQQSGAALSGLSVLGRFNSLIVDFISLFVRFISLFGRVGNLHSGVLQYQ